MNKQDFSSFVRTTLEEVIRCAEKVAGKPLPRNIAFSWLSDWMKGRSEPLREHVVETIVERVYQDEDHIYPCVDIGVADLLPDGSVLIVANVTGYEPRPFQQNWTGNEGPFVHIVGQPLLDRLAGRPVAQAKSFVFSIPSMKGQA